MRQDSRKIGQISANNFVKFRQFGEFRKKPPQFRKNFANHVECFGQHLLSRKIHLGKTRQNLAKLRRSFGRLGDVEEVMVNISDSSICFGSPREHTEAFETFLKIVSTRWNSFVYSESPGPLH